MKNVLRIVFTFILVILSSCSILDGEPTKLVQVRVLSLSDLYLTAIQRGEVIEAQQYILWPEYLLSNKKYGSKEDVLKEMAAIPKKYTEETSPIFGLRPGTIRGTENEVRVSLVKQNGSGPTIKITYKWIGNAWLIIDDNLFGDDSIFE